MRGTLCAQHNQVGLLGSSLVEKFFCRISDRDDGLDVNLIPQLERNQREEVRFIWAVLRLVRTSTHSWVGWPVAESDERRGGRRVPRQRPQPRKLTHAC